MIPGYTSFEHYRLSCPELRYGQAFCNFHQLHDPELFYEKEESKARSTAAVYKRAYQSGD